MEKYDFITCMNLHKKLKERIKGGIFISIDNGQLSININGGRGIRYRSYINDLPKGKEQIQKYYEYPELLEMLPEEERSKWQRYIDIYIKIKEQEQIQQEQNKQKQENLKFYL